MGGRRWTPAEVAKVRELYPAHGTAWAGWAKELPGREPMAIGYKAHELGVRVEDGVSSANRRQTIATGGGKPRRKPKAAAAKASARASPARRERWTDAQRMAVARHLRDMCRETGHTLNECCEEWNRMIDGRMAGREQ